MYKCLINAILACFVLLLASCQSMMHSTVQTPMYSPYAVPGSNQAPTLAGAVQNALIQTGDPVLAQVRVESYENKVVLRGYVKKIRQSDMAEQIATKVPGVQTVKIILLFGSKFFNQRQRSC